VEYLLCYAAAGLTLRFCVMERGHQKPVQFLDNGLQLDRPVQLLEAIFTSIKLFGVLMQQATQLPDKRICLGLTEANADTGTTITYYDDHVEKVVDVEKQLWLKGAKAQMEQVYAAVQGCEYLIHHHSGRIKITEGFYRVKLEPVGSKLDGPPSGRQRLHAVIK
jgi:hypothetical protein